MVHIKEDCLKMNSYQNYFSSSSCCNSTLCSFFVVFSFSFAPLLSCFKAVSCAFPAVHGALVSGRFQSLFRGRFPSVSGCLSLLTVYIIPLFTPIVYWQSIHIYTNIFIHIHYLHQ